MENQIFQGGFRKQPLLPVRKSLPEPWAQIEDFLFLFTV